jgi:hypothetical protein
VKRYVTMTKWGMLLNKRGATKILLSSIHFPSCSWQVAGYSTWFLHGLGPTAVRPLAITSPVRSLRGLVLAGVRSSRSLFERATAGTFCFVMLAASIIYIYILLLCFHLSYPSITPTYPITIVLSSLTKLLFILSDRIEWKRNKLEAYSWQQFSDTAKWQIFRASLPW